MFETVTMYDRYIIVSINCVLVSMKISTLEKSMATIEYRIITDSNFSLQSGQFNAEKVIQINEGAAAKQDEFLNHFQQCTLENFNKKFFSYENAYYDMQIMDFVMTIKGEASPQPFTS